MNRKWLRRMAVPIIVTCMGLANCSSETTTTTSLPTAFAVLRLNLNGTPDTTLGGRGIVKTKIDPALFDFALAVAIEPAPSNKIIAGGSSGLAGQGVIALVRYNATDGSLDGSFGAGGIVKTTVPSVASSASAITVQPDGKILVAALTFNATTGDTGIALLRYTASGALDATFNALGAVPGIVTAAIGPGNAADTCTLALQGDGKIVVAGASRTGDVVLYRYDGTGALDPGFGSSGKTVKNIGTLARPPAIALQSSGKIIVATGTDADQVVLRFGTDGVLDTTFSGSGVVTTDIGGSVNYANAVAVQSNDKIVVAGHANFTANTSDMSLVRYTLDGALDTTFNTTGIAIKDFAGRFDNALSVVLQAQPANEPLILVSGNTGLGGFTQIAVLRYTPLGSPDLTFGPGGDGTVVVQVDGPSNIASGNAVALQPVGTGVGIVVAGYD